jgi:regulator of sirC expression with transglutaminase-like and TPR domain
MRMLVYVFLLLSFLCPQLAWANSEVETKALVAKVEALFAGNSDWANIKFRADGIADASQNNNTARNQLERLTTALQAFITDKQPRNDHEKLHLLKMFVYQSGPWNDHRPFAYDLTDPFGKIREHRYLANYLEGRKGNCVTMPILFAILGKRIGLNMTLAMAPRHVFVKFTDDAGREWNLEATSGAGYTRDSHYRKEMPMKDAAVENGLYLKALTNTEAIATLADTITEELMQKRAFEQVIAVSDVMLKHHPKSIVAILRRGSSFAAIVQRDILSRYKYVSELTPAQLLLAETFDYQNMLAFQTAETLGWTENDGEKDSWSQQQTQNGEVK